MKKTQKTVKTDTVNYITKDGLEKLKGEFNNRIKTLRPEIAEKIDEARRFGDLSENSAYTSAMEEKNFNEARIFELEGLLATSQVVEASLDGSVSLGSEVHLKGEKGIVIYIVVGAEESDPMKNLISDRSPLGASLMGKKQGDTIEVKIPSGTLVFKIEKIKTS